MSDALIRRGRIVDPSQNLDAPGDLLVRDGKIARLWPAGEAPNADGVLELDAAGLVVTPGFIDLHVHLREPGHEEKETIATGSQAAVAGGFTTICAMPNTEPATDSAAMVEYVGRVAAAGAARVLVVAAVSKGRQGKELAELGELAAAGAVGFSDDGNPVASNTLLRNALAYSRMLRLPIMDHCEDPELTKGGQMNEGPVATRLGLKGTPAAAEEVLVARDVALAELTGGWAHICHISTARAVAIVRDAKARGVRVTAEATPHHLVMTDELVMGRWPLFPGSAAAHLPYDTNTKVNPPLRSRVDVEALLAGLRDGTIDAIATDHAPHHVLDKECEYDFAAPGLSGLETALPALLLLVEQGKLSLAEVIRALTVGPARLLGRELGSLRPGGVADVTVFDPSLAWQVTPDALFSKGKNTPFLGETVKGKVVLTLREGRAVHGATRLTQPLALER
ncbi:MAG: dihydroorotase [Chloroflexi bacterium]|nr:dihydroorotase [Chloroflexota bacterium]MCL5110159.1 dihydroorotase [Chloroflexota bacterium]